MHGSPHGRIKPCNPNWASNEPWPEIVSELQLSSKFNVDFSYFSTYNWPII